jgi:hypothetical protein
MKIWGGLSNTTRRFLTSYVGLLAVLASAGLPGFCLAGSEPVVHEQQQEKTAEQQFKSIQVFQGLPASQLIPAMSFMRSALGVQCTYCHVSDREFDKEDKPEKETTRKMIKMVREVNQSNFGGRNEVTCNTCHHGQAHPPSQLAFADISAKVVQPPVSPAERRTSEPLPNVNQVIEKYVQAVGGKSAIQKVETRVMKGIRTASEGWNTPIEVCQKAPNKMLVTFRSDSISSSGFNGTSGWSQSNRGLWDVSGPNLVRLKREAEFSRSLKLQDEYQNLRVLGKQPVGDREAYVVQGTPTGENRPERLYFDVQTGLLLRTTTREMTPLGPLPEETDFDDYREVDSIKLPFVVVHLRPDHSYKDVFLEISQNVSIDDAKFEKPTDSAK